MMRFEFWIGSKGSPRLPIPLRFLHLGIVALFLVGSAAAQSADTHAVDWISKPDRQDFPWKVQVLPPRLTFQQRNLVQVRISLDSEALQKVGTDSDLNFLVRIADKDGRWLPGESYRPFHVPTGLDKHQEIQFDTGMYLRAGEYSIAVLAYDRSLKNYNLTRRPLRVPEVKDDPVPELDSGLPQVEFITDIPKDSINPASVEMTAARLPRIGGPRVTITRVGPLNDQTWPLGHGIETLQIATPQPIRIDLILDFSDWTDPNFRVENSGQGYRQDVGRLLQMASLLSHLSPKEGCVHVSALDILKMKVLIDRQDAKTLNWDFIQKQANSLDQATVDVRALNAHNQTQDFFAKFVAQISNSSGCESKNQTARHFVIVAPTSRLALSGHGDDGMAKEEDGCFYFYLKPPVSPRDPGADDIKRVLKPKKPIEFDISDPGKFRKDLAKLIAEIERRSTGGISARP